MSIIDEGESLVFDSPHHLLPILDIHPMLGRSLDGDVLSQEHQSSVHLGHSTYHDKFQALSSCYEYSLFQGTRLFQ